jgi:hypothetical protein
LSPNFVISSCYLDVLLSLSLVRDLRFKKARFMTDPSMASETPDVAEIASFLRRFADLMSTGYNAAYLQRAADLLETLTDRVIAASDEENLWRHKCEAAIDHADALEAECDALKHDIDGHLTIASSILAERDALRAKLQGREIELSELRAAVDREREALNATVKARSEERDRLRGDLDRERQDGAAKQATREGDLSELRVAFERERGELQAKLRVSGDELAALRVVSRREYDALKAKVTSLEAKRAELRATFDRISDLRHQTGENPDSVDRAILEELGLAAQADPFSVPQGDRASAIGEANAVVPKATLRQARAQFEYLAKDCVSRGDIASQVMCELGAYTMDLALVADRDTDHSPVGEVALKILAPSDPAPLAVADTV